MPPPRGMRHCLSLTGPVADNSRSAQLAHEIWREDINSRGGLLGLPVELLEVSSPDGRRCHDRSAECVGENDPWSAAQWICQLRVLVARAQNDVPRRNGVHGTIRM